mgnify:CR=1 FL=1
MVTRFRHYSRAAPVKLRQIFVKGPTGKTVCVMADRQTTAWDVKVSLSRKCGLPPDELVLSKSSRNLEDSRTLTDYKIQNGATLFVQQRVRGGSPVQVEHELTPGELWELGQESHLVYC